MADRPIIFAAPMVRALMAGRKSQTRRVLKRGPDGRWFVESSRLPIRLPYAPGDRLWVREAWKSDREFDDLAPSEMGGEEPLIYLADNEVQRWGWKLDFLSRWGRYRNARFMPRWASRLTLVVTDVRVQRLQEISEADVWAEGIPGGNLADCYGPACPSDPGRSCNAHGCWATREQFRDLWNNLHGPDAWDASPWVAALTFTAHRLNIDQMEAPNA